MENIRASVQQLVVTAVAALLMVGLSPTPSQAAASLCIVTTSEGQAEPVHGACNFAETNREIYQNLSGRAMLITVKVVNTGTCRVRVGSPSHIDRRAGANILGGRTLTFTLRVGPRGTDDANGHATDVLAAACDDTRDKCQFTTDIVSAVRA